MDLWTMDDGETGPSLGPPPQTTRANSATEQVRVQTRSISCRLILSIKGSDLSEIFEPQCLIFTWVYLLKVFGLRSTNYSERSLIWRS